MIGVAGKIAWRELRGGLASFWVYLACLALGTAAIAAAGSVTEVFTRGLAGEARQLLGGDAAFVSMQRRAQPDERRYIETLGAVTESAAFNVMATRDTIRRQVDVTAVDAAYPLLGSVVLSGSSSTLEDALSFRDGVWGTAVSASFLEVFQASIGDSVTIGPLQAEIRAQIDQLPDDIGTPGAFGPEVLVHMQSLAETDRLNDGQLFRATLVVLQSDPDPPEALKAAYESALPESSLRLRTPVDAVDGLQNLLTTLNSFLAIIGIAALIAGGVGVAQATSAFLETRITTIAALKALGAEAATLRLAYMLQLGALALIGAVVGIAIGAASPYLLVAFAGGSIPLPRSMGIYPAPLIQALLLGILAAVLFALPAIGRARATPPAALFRGLQEDSATSTPWLERGGALAAAGLLCLIAIAYSTRPLLTCALLLGAMAAWGVFWAAAILVKRVAARLVHSVSGALRLTLSNLAGPGSLASTIVPSLGLGLALLTLVAAVQANLLRQISETAPANAPSVVFSQIPSDKTDVFDQIIAGSGVDISDDTAFRRAPFLLVRVTSLRGAPIVEDEVAEEERWVVRGETSVTYMAEQPAEAVLTEGAWWEDGYAGPLLVSVEIDVARGLGVTVGDRLGFSVFGREIEATVASLRISDWGSFGIGANTAFIFSPGTLEAANPYHVAIAKSDPEAEQQIIRELGLQLPDVVVFQTRAALATAARLFADIAVAVNAAAGVVTLAGLLVLFGAFAAMAQKRRREAALLKTFGAMRGQILQFYAMEFGIAGGTGALLGACLGVLGAYPIVTLIFEAEWSWPWLELVSVMALAIGVSAIGGALVGVRTLAHKPAAVLRSV